LRPAEKIASPGSVRIDQSEPLPDLSIRQEHYVATWVTDNKKSREDFSSRLYQTKKAVRSFWSPHGFYRLLYRLKHLSVPQADLSCKKIITDKSKESAIIRH